MGRHSQQTPRAGFLDRHFDSPGEQNKTKHKMPGQQAPQKIKICISKECPHSHEQAINLVNNL